MNIFNFLYADVVKFIFVAIGYGTFFGLFIGLVRFLVLSFFERQSA